MENKKSLKNFLFKNGVQTRDFFFPLSNQPCFKKAKLIKNISSQFPNTDYLYKCGLSLPSSYDLTKKELHYIVNIITEFYAKKKS